MCFRSMRLVLFVLGCFLSESHGQQTLHFKGSDAEEHQTSKVLDVETKLKKSRLDRKQGTLEPLKGLAMLLVSFYPAIGAQLPSSRSYLPRSHFKRWKRRLAMDADEDDELEKLDRIMSKVVFLVPILLRLASNVLRFSVRFLRLRPRVMVISLSGVIMSQDELRLSSYYNDVRPELLYPESAGAQQPPQSALFELPIITLDKCNRLFTRAFKARGVRAVALVINSPGGSPAESSLIFQRLRALRQQHKRVPLLVFVKDYAASGGYYIACAADEIIADPSSLVGSIGVISQSFGYVQRLKREGMTRRVHTSGKQKGGVDPYLPERRRDLAMEKRLLTEIHNNFIAAVNGSRGGKLKPEAAARLHLSVAKTDGGVTALLLGKPSRWQLAKLVREGAGLFDGSVYSGSVGLDLGLVDGVGEMRTELQKRFGRHVNIDEVNGRPWLLRMLLD